MGTFNVNNLLGGNVMGDLSQLGLSDMQARTGAAQSANAPAQPGFGDLVKLIETGSYDNLPTPRTASKDHNADANVAGNANDVDSIGAAALEEGLLDGLNAIDAIDAEGGDSDAVKASFVNALTFEERLRMGNELLAHAFKKIAALLDAPEEEFSQSLMVEFNPDDADQFAAIMWYIDTTVKMIGEKDAGAFAENMKRDFGADTLADIPGTDDTAALTELANGLRKEKFHLEMAFRLIGVHEVISEMAAEKSNQGVATGIPRAANPADLGMSVSDLARAFGSLIKEELTSAMERVRMITSGQAEMTALEKAAVRLGTVNSEILKAALSGAGSPNSAAFENVNLKTAKPDGAEIVNTEIKADANTEIKADANTAVKVGVDADGKADVNTKAKAGAEIVAAADTEIKAGTGGRPAAKKAAESAALPISARESTGMGTRERTESANRRAFESVSVVAKAKDGGVGLPISARESTNRAAADAVTPTGGKVAEVVNNNNAQVRTSAANDIAIPVSVKEPLKKSAVDGSVTVDRKISVNANAEASVKSVSGESAAVPVSVKESANRGAANGGVRIENRTPESVTAETQVKPVSGSNVEIPISAGEPTGRKTLENAAPVNNKVTDNVNTTVKTESVPVNSKAAGNVNPAVKAESVTLNGNGSDNVNPTVKADNVSVNNNGTGNINAAVKTESVPVNNNGADNVSAAVKADNIPVNNEVNDNVNPAVKAESVPVANDGAGNVNTTVKANGAHVNTVGANADANVNTDAVDDTDVENAPVFAAKEPTLRKSSENVDFNAKAGNPVTENAVITANVAEHAGRKQNGNGKSGDDADRPAPKASVNTEKSTGTAGPVNDNAGTAKPETPVRGAFAAKSKNDAASNSAAKANANGKPDNVGSGAIGGGNKSPSSDNLIFSGLENSAVESEEASAGGSEFSSAEPASPKAAAVEHTEKAQAAPSSRFESEAVIRQINERLQQAVRNGAHEVRMTLRPEALGEVRMSIRVEGDVVMARMQVENRQVKAIVESNLQSLKDMLEKHNMQFGAVSVDVGTDADTDRSPRQAWQELAEAAGMSGARGFREGGIAEGSDGNEAFDALSGARGSDTGRRFGNNTFEYFI